ncbi:hypothetical protein, partial [Glutamicibacter creatinolyticus]
VYAEVALQVLPLAVG